MDKFDNEDIRKLNYIEPGQDHYDEEQKYMRNIMANPEELQFLKDYRKLEDLEKDKYTKFFICIGDPKLTLEFRKRLINSRL